MNAEAIDRLLREPAIVFGSLPPDNRDLDLLVSAAEHRRLATELQKQGWTTRDGRTWAQFSGGTAFGVDLVVLDRWAPNAVVSSLLRESALTLERCRYLRAPATHHRVLILARRYREGMTVSAKKRAVLQDFAPGDWERAQSEADTWGLRDALAELRREVDEPSTGTRLRWRPWPRRQRIVSLSGLDGAGKSTHAEHLRTALAALGYEARVEWTKIARDPVLDRIALPIKRLLTRIGGEEEPVPLELVDAAGERRNHPDGPPPPRDAGALRRERSAALTWAWSFVVALANARTHRRTVTGKRSGVVICDRYVLDSAAHLRYRYGAHRRFRAHRMVVRLLSPAPACAFLLDVPPATARQRKPEQYTTSDLTHLQRLYHEEARRLGVVVIDVERPEHEVAAQIAREAWLRLTSADHYGP